MNRRLVTIALFAAALLLFTIGVASADLKAVAPPSSWDYNINQGNGGWQNSNIVLRIDADLQPFYAELGFDGDERTDACDAGTPAGTSTTYAGFAEIGLYNTDSAPGLGQGFISTRDWALYPCKVFVDTKTYTAPKFPPADQVLASCLPATEACQLLTAPPYYVEQGCGSGNCFDEIVTDFDINLDTDCDGDIDDAFLTAYNDGGVCLYWAAEKPPLSPPYWEGPLQVRYGTQIGGGTGDKVLTFNLEGPNAVTISDVKAVAEDNKGSLIAWAGGMLFAAAGLFIWRRNS